MGQIKKVNGYDVYVKSEHCEDSLKDIINHLKTDANDHPNVRFILGEWRFLEEDLINLLIFHKKDKKLSFLTAMIMAQLTEPPKPECRHKLKFYGILRSYKSAFLKPNVIQTLMEHLADCLKRTDRNEKHQQMIELIIVIF